MNSHQTNDPLRKMEISNLKFELNPHTFKNILQQIQSLSLSTNRAIENLMQILNYMLYNTDREQVTLQEEVDFMIAYKKMQQSIVPGFVDIVFKNELSESFAKRKAIAPLLTVAFLENAFKHAPTDSKNCLVEISMKDLDENNLLYVVSNTSTGDKPGHKESGIGYKNLRRRLDLMYEKKYLIEAVKKDDMYRASLNINLADYEN